MRIRQSVDASDNTSENNTEKASRPSRVPVSGNRDILAVQNIPEHKIARWVNDVDNRILKFQQGGWEFVTDQGVVVGQPTVESSKAVGKVVTKIVGTKKTNEPLYAYLMVIDRDWYNEDQRSKQDNVDANEQMIYNNLRANRDYGTFDSEFK